MHTYTDFKNTEPSLLFESLNPEKKVVGIDEAGRGPLAGPVTAAAVLLNTKSIPLGINDSKKLTKKNRNKLYKEIINTSIVGIASASVEEIDRLNIHKATMLAMRRAFICICWKIGKIPDIALIDGNQSPRLPCKIKTIIKGDTKSISIAAASIVAKVSRDNFISEIAAQFPEYKWNKNAGYGTKEHLLGLTILGKTPHHRNSFRPIRHK
tara:strand:- start:427 stop:1056 length:630 start_codon:yes stop_codon:yes gene_type:complete